MCRLFSHGFLLGFFFTLKMEAIWFQAVQFHYNALLYIADRKLLLKFKCVTPAAQFMCLPATGTGEALKGYC
jgi:hypothetical protein